MMNHFTRKRLSCLTINLLFCLAGIGITTTVYSQTDQNSEVELKEFDQDTNALTKIGESPNLAKFEAAADETLKRWQGKDAQKYSELVANVGALLSFTDFRSKRQYAVAENFILSHLSQPEHLLIEHHIGLVHDLGLIDSNLQGKDWKRVRMSRIQLWIAVWERIEREYNLYKDFHAPVYLSIPPPLNRNDPQQMKTWNAAYEKNMRNVEINNRKTTLTNEMLFFPQQARQFFIEAYSQAPGNLNDLRYLLRNAAVDEKTKETVMKEVVEGVRLHPAITQPPFPMTR